MLRLRRQVALEAGAGRRDGGWIADRRADQAREAVQERGRVLVAELVRDLVQQRRRALREAARAELSRRDEQFAVSMAAVRRLRVLPVEDLPLPGRRIFAGKGAVEGDRRVDALALRRGRRAALCLLAADHVRRALHADRGELRAGHLEAVSLGQAAEAVVAAPRRSRDPAVRPLEAQLAVDRRAEQAEQDIVPVAPLGLQQAERLAEPLRREAFADRVGDALGVEDAAVAIALEGVDGAVARDGQALHRDVALRAVGDLAAELAAIVDLAVLLAGGGDVDGDGAGVVRRDERAEVGIVLVIELVAGRFEGGEDGLGAALEAHEGALAPGGATHAVAELAAERHGLEHDLELGLAGAGADREPMIADADERADLETLAEAAGGLAVELGGGADVGEQLEVELGRASNLEGGCGVVPLDDDVAEGERGVEEVLEDIAREGRKGPLDAVRVQDCEADEAGNGAHEEKRSAARDRRPRRRAWPGPRSGRPPCRSRSRARPRARRAPRPDRPGPRGRPARASGRWRAPGRRRCPGA